MIGSKLAHYDITGHLGSGGMGDVYQATDSKLGRSVAIKVLSEAFARDTDRVMRFEREARVLAALNHPNIAAIYGLEQVDRGKFLVMELVEGETLAERIKRGPIPVAESLGIAKQIAEALEEAHEKGIIHRDLKPANIKVTSDGKVKVLDFGLAKAYEADASNANLSNSPTIASIAGTNVGVIMGTAAYMSPEQAKGRPVDRRTDIFAFGCILYEMLTGRRAFDGEDVSDILSAVLRMEPDLRLIPADVPPPVRNLLRLCLEKSAKNRRADATDVRLDIEEALKPAEPAAVGAHVPRSSVLPWILVAVLTLLVVALALTAWRYIQLPRDTTVRRFSVGAPYMPNTNQVAVSPDGRLVTYLAVGADGITPLLWIRPIDSITARSLAGTELATGTTGAQAALHPFWSPDSRFIGFFSPAERKLKKIDVRGGAPQTICEMAAGYGGGTWSDSGTIVFSDGATLYRVPAGGGTPIRILELDVSKQETAHRFPFFLSNSDQFLFSAWSTDESKRAIYLGSLDGTKPTHLLAAASMPAFAPPGYLLYQREGTLMAQVFNVGSRRLEGDAVPIAENLGFNAGNGRSSFTVSREGTLAYTAGGGPTRSQLHWYDRSGKEARVVGSPDTYQQVRLSPNEKVVVYQRWDIDSGSTAIWTLDLTSGITSKFFSIPGNVNDPVWSPDSRQVAFRLPKGIVVKDLGGTVERLLFASDQGLNLEDWSSDGQWLVFRNRRSINALPLLGDLKPNRLFESSFVQDEVRRQVSNSGGSQPRWRKDGRELFYLSTDAKLMSVAIGPGPVVESGPPKVLFQTKIVFNQGVDQFDATADGKRFLLLEAFDRPQEVRTPITVVLNWIDDIKRVK